jgi:hypothetical protein
MTSNITVPETFKSVNLPDAQMSWEDLDDRQRIENALQPYRDEFNRVLKEQYEKFTKAIEKQTTEVNSSAFASCNNVDHSASASCNSVEFKILQTQMHTLEKAILRYETEEKILLGRISLLKDEINVLEAKRNELKQLPIYNARAYDG